MPEIDTFVSEVEAKRFFNKESSQVLSVNILNLHNSSLVNSFFKLRCLSLEYDWTPAWRGSQVLRSPRHILGLNASSACLGSPWRERDTLRGSHGEASWARRQQTSEVMDDEQKAPETDNWSTKIDKMSLAEVGLALESQFLASRGRDVERHSPLSALDLPG